MPITTGHCDGITLRLYEPDGACGVAQGRDADPIEAVDAVNVLEVPVVEQLDERTVRFPIRPFRNVTLQLS